MMSNPGEIKVDLSVPQVMKLAYWGLLALGLLFIMLGFNGNYGFLIGGCFFGIVSRVLQAEFHYSNSR